MVQTEPIAYKENGDLPRTEAEISLLDVLVLLAENKRFLLRFVLGAAALAARLSAATNSPIALTRSTRLRPRIPWTWNNS